MSCYFRHLKDVLSEAGIEVTPANKKQIDQAIKELEYKTLGAIYSSLDRISIKDIQARLESIFL